MTTLTIYADDHTTESKTLTDFDAIVRRLGVAGIHLERWEADRPLSEDADQEEVLTAYKDNIDRLNQQYGFRSVDVISIYPDHRQRIEMRQKFLSEHTHDDFEVRFFVDGQGLFYLHIGSKVYTLLCTKGDLISVPAGVTHWFDMGRKPDFKCIRFFTTVNGWVGNFTGSDIARQFPDFDDFVASLN